MICLDGMGPQSAKSIPGQQPVRAEPAVAADPGERKPSERARQEIDYGRRGRGYVFGSFRPATGEARARRSPAPHPPLRRAHHRQLAGLPGLGGLPGADGPLGPRRGGDRLRHRGQPLDAPGGGRSAVQSGPPALGVRLPAGAKTLVRGVPEPDRAVVEGAALSSRGGRCCALWPWWKVLRSLALKGRRFETRDEIVQAVAAATAYWNAHRHPFVWGRRRRHRPKRKAGLAVMPTAA